VYWHVSRCQVDDSSFTFDPNPAILQCRSYPLFCFTDSFGWQANQDEGWDPAIAVNFDFDRDRLQAINGGGKSAR
jgi:hypothetical protein